MEVWKNSRFENFEVSNLGRVRNKRTGNIFTGTTNDSGYVYVSLYVNGKSKSVRLHRLVAETFVENPSELPEVNHKNGNKKDNRVSNLEWVTHTDNIEHSMKTGLCVGGIQKVTDEQIDYIRRNFVKGDRHRGYRAIARKIGLSHTTVRRYCEKE